jgi:uncharacterized RDD family membrane protein YckC
MPPLRPFDPHPPHRAESLRGLPLASFRRRAAALVIDFVVAGICFMLFSLPALKILISLKLVPDRDMNIQFGFFDNWYSVVWLFLFLGVSNHVGNGRTIGKRLLKIRAVSLVHDRLRGWPAFERALAYGASALELGFGFLQYFIHPNRQTVHDRIAETIVIDERAAGAPDVPR